MDTKQVGYFPIRNPIHHHHHHLKNYLAELQMTSQCLQESVTTRTLALQPVSPTHPQHFRLLSSSPSISSLLPVCLVLFIPPYILPLPSLCPHPSAFQVVTILLRSQDFTLFKWHWGRVVRHRTVGQTCLGLCLGSSEHQRRPWAVTVSPGASVTISTTGRQKIMPASLTSQSSYKDQMKQHYIQKQVVITIIH